MKVPAAGGERDLFQILKSPPVKAELLGKVEPIVKPFVPYGPRTPLPPQPQTTIVPPEKPPAPITFKFYGTSAIHPDGTRTGYFIVPGATPDADRIFMANEGTVVEGHFRIVQIGADKCTIEDTTDKRTAAAEHGKGDHAMRRRHRKDSGFAMLLVFLMAACIAITLYMEVPRVAFEAERQRELLLVDRGNQFKRAIQVFVTDKTNNPMRRFPASLDEMESFNNHRYLRHRYVDPMTGKDEWRLVHMSGGVLTDSVTTQANRQRGAQAGAGAGTGAQGHGVYLHPGVHGHRGERRPRTAESRAPSTGVPATGWCAGTPDPNNPGGPPLQNGRSEWNAADSGGTGANPPGMPVLPGKQRDPGINGGPPGGMPGGMPGGLQSGMPGSKVDLPGGMGIQPTWRNRSSRRPIALSEIAAFRLARPISLPAGGQQPGQPGTGLPDARRNGWAAGIRRDAGRGIRKRALQPAIGRRWPDQRYSHLSASRRHALRHARSDPRRRHRRGCQQIRGGRHHGDQR